MNFPDYLATEHADEFGDKSCWRLEVTPAPARLVVRCWQVSDGQEKYHWSYSVLVSDLDPQSVTVDKAYDEGDLHHLKVLGHFYRDAIITRREYEPDFEYRNAIFRLPLAKEITDLEAARDNFQKFLVAHGARPAVIRAEDVADLLKPFAEALKPAQGVLTHSNDRRTTFEQTASVDGGKVHLVRRMERVAGRKLIPFWELPMAAWKFRKGMTPAVETETFELLSMDTAAGDAEKLPDEADVWMVSLYSVEHQDTRLHQNSANASSYRMWYVKIFFPSEATAGQFLKICAETVKQIRERLRQKNVGDSNQSSA